MRAGSLFSGVGGLDLAAHGALGAEPAWMCEADSHCRTILEQRFPGVPVLPDIRELDHTASPIDLLHGGYPCQPFSVAGKREGENDPRHLWPEFARCIRVLRPRLVIAENVAGHLALGFDRVLADLAEMGMDVRWGTVRASDAGAPHRRERLFIVAHAATDRADTAADTERERPHRGRGRDTRGEAEGRGDRGGEPPGHRPSPADPDERGQQDGGQEQDGLEASRRNDTDRRDASAADAEITERRTSQQQSVGAPPGSAAEHRERAGKTAWGVYEPAIRRWEHTLGRPAPPPTDDRGRLMPEFVEWMMGFPTGWTEGVARTHRLRMLGNAVVPHQGTLALRLLTSHTPLRKAAA